MNELNRTSNAVFSLRYHFIMTVKYRKQIFVNNEIVEYLKSIITEISNNNDVTIIAQECGADHVHLLFECKPSLDITKYINVLKGNSSRKLRKQYADYLQPLLFGDALWSPSYYLATAGNVSLNNLIDYVNTQQI